MLPVRKTESLKREFAESGFEIEAFYADVAGRDSDPEADECAIVAKDVTKT